MSFELSEKVSVPLVEKDVVTESNSNQSNNNMGQNQTQINRFMAYDNNVNAKNASGGAPLYKSNNIKEVMNTSAPICISSYIKGNQGGNRPMTKGASRRQASFNNANGA